MQGLRNENTGTKDFATPSPAVVCAIHMHHPVRPADGVVQTIVRLEV